MKLNRRCAVLLGLLLVSLVGFGSAKDSVVIFDDKSTLLKIDNKIFFYEDKVGNQDFNQVVQRRFEASEQGTPNIGFTSSTIWVKLNLLNLTRDSLLFIAIEQPSIDDICLHHISADGQISISCLGETRRYSERFLDYPNYLFPIVLNQGATGTYYLSIKSKDQIQLPISLGTERAIFEQYSLNNLIFGIYAGIVLVMILYNMFIALTVKDVVYLYYIVYIFFVGLTQALFQGYAFKFLWPDSLWLAKNSSVLVPFLSGISTILFIREFLQIKRYVPQHNVGLHILTILYLVSLVLGLLGHYYTSIMLLQLTASSGSIYVIYVAFLVKKKGFRPALFFLIAFSVFLLSVVIFVLRNFNVVPYNAFTTYILEIGSIIQIILLSFALADKINSYKKEKEESQFKMLEMLKDNEKLIREQNAILEQRVEKRTRALRESNDSLQTTLNHLKETQSQLVEAEKMASLGQLTAGVAHEINNPINFVTSNVAPLKRDIGMMWEVMDEIEKVALSDLTTEEKTNQIAEYKEELDVDYLKTEIEFLLKGMHEGASRTAEIVKSLRIFSRVDEDSLKYADINEGLESTLVILNSVVKDNVQVTKKYSDSPIMVECYPGKLNQVFLNIITNAIYAINKKFVGESGGVLVIATEVDSAHAYITIQDNGIGMSTEVMEKVFEPFFTTKEVGEGTGLGMSIVYNTIKKHQGEIKIDSTVGEGTTFRLIIPLRQQIQQV